jgi:hypothetical protein
MTTICGRINRSLCLSLKLKKIDLSFNFIRGRLCLLMNGMKQELEYLNLQDCRLEKDDIEFLNKSSMNQVLENCRELNLSMNDLSQCWKPLFSIISSCHHLNCLSISYCQIPIDIICSQLASNIILLASSKKNKTKKLSSSNELVRNIIDPDQFVPFSKLKVIYIQPFIPPKMHEIMDILHVFSAVKSLQKLHFLPSLYAFPGENDYEREQNALRTIQICTAILESKSRSDIEFINI